MQDFFAFFARKQPPEMVAVVGRTAIKPLMLRLLSVTLLSL